MPPSFSKPQFIGFAVFLSGVAVQIRRHGEKTSVPRVPKGQELVKPKEKSKSDRVAVDRSFVKRVWRLLKIMVPGVFSTESAYAAAVAVLLVARTWADVWMLRNRTTIEAKIISGDNAGFMHHLKQFMMASLPIAAVNNLLKHSLFELQIRMRTRLTRHLLDEYMRGYTYYQSSTLDNRLANVDQLITQDVAKFTQSCTDLYSNVSKPILDACLYSYSLASSIGIQGPGNMLAYLAVSGAALTWLRRPVGRFTVHETRLEGEFRYVNSRLIAHSEEVAFYNGNAREKHVITTMFERLVGHMRRAQQFRFSVGVLDTIVAKYFATVVGFWVVSRPFFKHTAPPGSKILTLSHSERLEQYYESGRMLLNLASAVGRLVLAGREMTRLAGFTARVTQLIDVLDDLNAGKYARTMVGGAEAKAERAASGAAAGGKKKRPAIELHTFCKGTVMRNDNLIKFDGVPLVTPNGDVLIPSLDFEVPSGVNVLIAGPNGCGKSSLFRTLGELWPLFGGVLTKPQKNKLFYVPQKPYLTLGTFRDQIIYPHRKEDMPKLGLTDADLLGFLQDVHLESLLDREGGWDAVQDWADVLSGGEKQRVAMARIFASKPTYAILDECTSAVSVDVEDFMYTKCRELGITLFTVSHRKSLWKHHEYVLQMDGRGNYEFRTISDDETPFGS